jgi:hypothetical protein
MVPFARQKLPVVDKNIVGVFYAMSGTAPRSQKGPLVWSKVRFFKGLLQNSLGEVGAGQEVDRLNFIEVLGPGNKTTLGGEPRVAKSMVVENPNPCRSCVAKLCLNVPKPGRSQRNGNAENSRAVKCFPDFRLALRQIQNGFLWFMIPLL